MKFKRIALLCGLLLASCGSTIEQGSGNTTHRNIKSATFVIQYGYNILYIEGTTPVTTLLYNDGYLSFSLPTPPERELIPGDKVTIEYYGELRAKTSYPATYELIDGEVISSSYDYTDFFKVDREEALASGIPYVVIGSYHSPYVSIDTYDGEIYASALKGNASSLKEERTLAALFCAPLE